MKSKSCWFLCLGAVANIVLSSCGGMHDRSDGMKGPEKKGSSFERFARDHKRSEECINIAKDASVRIGRSSADQCIESLVSFDQADCKGSARKVEPQKEFADKRIEFSAPLAPNYSCPETLTSRTSSPCSLIEIISGGTPYRLCVHEGGLVPLSWCEGPTDHCTY